jgi:hypothetical protein
MRHASFLPTGFFRSPSTPALSGSESRRKSFLSRLLDALHHSRRLQAEQVLRRYQQLIAGAEARGKANSNIGG